MLPRTLLVDDETEVRSMVRIALRLSRTGTVIGEAESSSKAELLARQHRPDLVVLDLLLPDASGREAFTAVRSAAPESGVVIFSSSDSDREWYEHRGAAYVPKNAGTPALVETIKTLRRNA